MKKCTICKEELDIGLFGKDSSRKGGLSAKCKPCAKEITLARKRKDPAKFREKAAKATQRHRKNLGKSERQAKWRFYRSNRRASENQATPSWLSEEQKQQIFAVYQHAKECEMLTGDKYHVDHIVPLKGENVSGLHVPWNLQVLPADINLQKGNRTPLP